MSERIETFAALAAEVERFRDDRDWEQFHTLKNLASASVELRAISVRTCSTRVRVSARGMETRWKPLPAPRGDSAFPPLWRFALLMRPRQAQETHGDPMGTFCKPEVTGSIPVRSIYRSPGNRACSFSSRTP